MAKFKCEISNSKEAILWVISGDIDEHSAMPEMDQSKSLIVNLRNVTLFNSYGVKLWSQWMRTNNEAVSITLEECPYIIVQNLGIVQGLVTDNTIVSSFFVPFINESGTEVKQVLFRLGIEFQNDGTVTMPNVLDSAGEPMELDANPKSYFLFLKKQSLKVKNN